MLFDFEKDVHTEADRERERETHTHRQRERGCHQFMSQNVGGDIDWCFITLE